jgi:hypothetical protein
MKILFAVLILLVTTATALAVSPGRKYYPSPPRAGAGTSGHGEWGNRFARPQYPSRPSKPAQHR